MSFGEQQRRHLLRVLFASVKYYSEWLLVGKVVCNSGFLQVLYEREPYIAARSWIGLTLTTSWFFHLFFIFFSYHHLSTKKKQKRTELMAVLRKKGVSAQQGCKFHITSKVNS